MQTNSIFVATTNKLFPASLHMKLRSIGTFVELISGTQLQLVINIINTSNFLMHWMKYTQYPPLGAVSARTGIIRLKTAQLHNRKHFNNWNGDCHNNKWKLAIYIIYYSISRRCNSHRSLKAKTALLFNLQISIAQTFKKTIFRRGIYDNMVI